MLSLIIAVLIAFVLLALGIYAMVMGYNCAVIGLGVLVTVFKGIFRRK